MYKNMCKENLAECKCGVRGKDTPPILNNVANVLDNLTNTSNLRGITVDDISKIEYSSFDFDSDTLTIHRSLSVLEQDCSYVSAKTFSLDEAEYFLFYNLFLLLQVAGGCMDE